MEQLTYFILTRKIFESAIWRDDPHILKLFIYLIGNARHSKEPKKYNGFEIKRGELVTSLALLSDNNEFIKNGRLQTWSRSKVSRMLKVLEEQEYIKILSDTYGTHISICKYDTYQTPDTYKTNTTETVLKRKRNDTETVLNTNKNDNNEENDNNEKEKSFAVEKTQPLDVDFIEDIISLFKITYRSFKNVEYISVGKKGKSNYQDRNAVGSLLKYIKAKYPGEDSEMTLNRFQSLFKNCFLIKETWLQNNMTLPIIFSKLNNIILYGNNGNKEPGITNKPKFDPNEFVREFSKQHG